MIYLEECPYCGMQLRCKYLDLIGMWIVTHTGSGSDVCDFRTVTFDISEELDDIYWQRTRDDAYAVGA